MKQIHTGKRKEDGGANPNFAPLDNVGKRLPYELVLEALAICSLNPTIVIGVSGLVFVDIAQAFVRTFRNLS